MGLNAYRLPVVRWSSAFAKGQVVDGHRPRLSGIGAGGRPRPDHQPRSALRRPGRAARAVVRRWRGLFDERRRLHAEAGAPSGPRGGAGTILPDRPGGPRPAQRTGALGDARVHRLAPAFRHLRASTPSSRTCSKLLPAALTSYAIAGVCSRAGRRDPRSRRARSCLPRGRRIFRRRTSVLLIVYDR